ncbi:hypothetical protein Anapl_16534 [Anas platyrhynchos]|uniref:Uncharacterized protein n=1 Tax=Anas platyrhynchos TaxID=8839 RepID=R0KWJ9_ANAPL|nr:hypothetical protein Anapl_16534 [Anas platyrhynchos]
MFDGVLLAKAWKHPFRDAEFGFHTQFPNFSTRDLKRSTQLQRRSHFPFLSHIEHKGSNSSSRIQMEVVQFLVWKPYITNIVYRNLEDRQPVPTHLPLASTHSPPGDEEKLMELLEEFSQKFKSPSSGT